MFYSFDHCIWILLWNALDLTLVIASCWAPNVCYTEPCLLDYCDLFDNDMSFPSQISNSHDVHHSLNNLHPSCKPDIPWKFSELSRCIIDNFHEWVMQIKVMTDCKEYTYTQGETTGHNRTWTRYIINGVQNDSVVRLRVKDSMLI